MQTPEHSYLKRLSPEHYKGFSYVHWTMSIARSQSSWLDEMSHSKTREILIHTSSRYNLLSPIYCLMPDHMHFLWIGHSQHSDQLKAARFFRKHINEMLKTRNTKLQKQAYDNVLKEKDREKEALVKVIHYIAENPARKCLTDNSRNWIYSGSIIPKYPNIDWRDEAFSDRLWQIHSREVQSELRRSSATKNS